MKNIIEINSPDIIIKDKKGYVIMERAGSVPYICSLPGDVPIPPGAKLIREERSTPDLVLRLVKRFKPVRSHNIEPSKVFKSQKLVGKLCIYPFLNNIVINDKFFNGLTRTEKALLYAHEKGHLLYDREEFCDIFAAATLKDLGYPDFAIFQALKNTLKLTPDNLKRIITILQYLTNESHKPALSIRRRSPRANNSWFDNFFHA